MLDLYVGTTTVRIKGPGRLDRGEIVDRPDAAVEAAVRLMPPVRRLLGHRVRLWWSGAICRPFVFTVPQGLRDPRTCAEVATAIAADRTGLSPPLAVWLDPSRGEAQLAAVAVSQSLLDQTRAAIAQAGGNVISAAPWWSEVLRQCLRIRDADTLCIRDSDSLTVLSGVGLICSFARSYVPITNEADAEAAWRRAAVLLDSAPAAGLRIEMDDHDSASLGPGSSIRVAHWGTMAQ